MRPNLKGVNRSVEAPVSRANGTLLWLLQLLLAALFLFAGGAKLMMPADQLTADSSLPVWFLRFIGVCEIAGALGLILPWALRIRPALTPLAAACLVVIMCGAVVVSTLEVGPMTALFPLVTGLLVAIVGRERWRQLSGSQAATAEMAR